MAATAALDVRSLILDEAPETQVAKRRAKKAAPPAFEVVMKDGCDIAVRRTTSSTSRLLVLLASQNQFYVKDEKTGGVKKLDSKTLRSFLQGLKNDRTIEIGADAWLPYIVFDSDVMDSLPIALDNKEFTEALRHGNAALSIRRSRYSRSYVLCRHVLKTRLSQWFCREVARHYDAPLSRVIVATGDADGARWGQVTIPHIDLDVVATIEYALGLDRGRMLLSAYLEAGLERMPKRHENMTRVLFAVYCGDYNETDYCRRGGVEVVLDQEVRFPETPRTFDIKSLIEYAVWAIYREGYADCPDDFWEQWGASYAMEEQLYGRIRTKYPEGLATHHQQLSYLARIHRNEIQARADAAEREEQKRRWSVISERLRPHRWSQGEYLITSPDSPQDMLDEAQAQSNCLASYVKQVERGGCMIFFMRRTCAPDQSLVTIEVYNSGQVGQVKAKNNADPTAEQLAFVSEWAASQGFSC